MSNEGFGVTRDNVKSLENAEPLDRPHCEHGMGREIAATASRTLFLTLFGFESSGGSPART